MKFGRRLLGMPMITLDGAGDGGGSGGGQGGGAKTPFMVFDSQEDFDKALGQRLGRERAKVTTEFQAKLDDLTAKLEEATKGGKGGKKEGDDNGEKRYTQAEVEALLSKARAEEFDPLKAENSKLKGLRIENEILSAATNAYSPKQVAELVAKNLGLDENGNVVVMDADGTPKLGSNGKPVTASQYVESYLAENKHLVKGSGVPGVGSQNRNATEGGSGGAGKVKTMADAQSALTAFLSSGQNQA